jgi:hypothetical protein
VAANVGLSITPNEEWNTSQALHFVEMQQAFSRLTGNPLEDNVVQGDTLPLYGPGDQLFIVGNCEGLYVSNGESYKTVPSQEFQRYNWMVVERGHTFQHTFRVTFNAPPAGKTESVPLVSAGTHTVIVTAQTGHNPQQVEIHLGLYGPGRPVYGLPGWVPAGSTHEVVVVTDPAKQLVQVSMDGGLYTSTGLTDGLPIRAATQHGDSGGNPPAVSVTNITASTAQPKLCRALKR